MVTSVGASSRNICYPVLARRHLANITAKDVDSWVDALTDSRLAASTVNQTLSVLQVMGRGAVRRELVREDPTSAVQRLSADAHSCYGVLSPEEARRLLDPVWLSHLWDNDLLNSTG